MARVTVEDCIKKIENRFELVLIAANRARVLANGVEPTIPEDNDKPGVVLNNNDEFAIIPPVSGG